MRAKVVLLAALLALGAVVVAAPPASALCVFNPEDPVGSARCTVNFTVACVRGFVIHGACPI